MLAVSLLERRRYCPLFRHRRLSDRPDDGMPARGVKMRHRRRVAVPITGSMCGRIGARPSMNACF
jgi:hypothetical protein